jgi:signal transduction histidine kinase
MKSRCSVTHRPSMPVMSEFNMLLPSVNADRTRSANFCPLRTTFPAADLSAILPALTVTPSAPPTWAEPSSAAIAIAIAQDRSRQTELLSMVAHEMRNALMPIRLAAAQLGQPCKDEAQLPRLRFVIEQQLAHLSRLVGDLLDASRAANGKFGLELVPVDLADVVKQAIDATQGFVASREQQLRTDLPPQALTVYGDPVRLAQVIGNLLTNASKYTPRGGAIEVSVVQVDATVQMTIADNGIGIAAEVLPHVFEPFVQEAHAVAFDGAGVGIGLTVVRDLVRAHGGNVVARSAGHGLGSQFVVTLPLARGAGTAIKQAAIAPSVCVLAEARRRRLTRRERSVAEACS